MSALCLGVASHLALDAVPHGDAGIGHWVHSSPNHVTKLQRLLPMVFVDQILGAGVFFSSSLIPPTCLHLFLDSFGRRLRLNSARLPDRNAGSAPQTAEVARMDPPLPRKMPLP